jgi:hypothetical protein
MATESTAVALTERIDALATALRAAGVPPEHSSGLLAAAAAATMHAVTLDALLDEQPQARLPAEPAVAVPTMPAAVPVPLAA